MKLCGYCRLAGHNFRICPIRLSQINDLTTHVVNERKEVHNRLLKFGYGVGALVNIRVYGDKVIPCVIRTMKYINNDSHFYDHNNKKYAKSVLLRLQSYTGVIHGITCNSEDYIRYVTRYTFYVRANPLDNMAKDVYGCINIRDYELSSSSRDLDLLVPSSETDMKELDFYTPFYVPERLTGDRNKRIITPFTPLLP